jgi:hypothetical protein
MWTKQIELSIQPDSVQLRDLLPRHGPSATPPPLLAEYPIKTIVKASFVLRDEDFGDLFAFVSAARKAHIVHVFQCKSMSRMTVDADTNMERRNNMPPSFQVCLWCSPPFFDWWGWQARVLHQFLDVAMKDYAVKTASVSSADQKRKSKAFFAKRKSDEVVVEDIPLVALGWVIFFSSFFFFFCVGLTWWVDGQLGHDWAERGGAAEDYGCQLGHAARTNPRRGTLCAGSHPPRHRPVARTAGPQVDRYHCECGKKRERGLFL